VTDETAKRLLTYLFEHSTRRALERIPNITRSFQVTVPETNTKTAEDGQKPRASFREAREDQQFLHRLTRFERVLHFILLMLFKRRDIIIGGELYMRRFFVSPRSWKKRLFLHCIIKPDDQRVLHDHPWDFATLILARGYAETFVDAIRCDTPIGPQTGYYVRVNRTRISLPRQFRKYKAYHTHAVNPFKGPAWTLVIAEQATRTWGFHTAEGWMDWRTYLGLPQDTPDHPEDIRRDS
jgi:hypothetical protein